MLQNYFCKHLCLGIMHQKNPSAYDLLKEITLSDLKKVDDIILSLAKSHVDIIPTVTEHLMSAGGKRIRPIITIACANMIGIYNSTDVMKMAAAVELIHTATLFHDDVIDNSDLRRGKKTANNIWGNKVAILLGDFLLSHAFQLMVDSKNIMALDLLSKTSIALTESEIWQLEMLGDATTNMDRYLKLIRGKTAHLFATACSISALLQEDVGQYFQSLYEFGMNLGILYQIVDDILDYSAVNPKFGKVLGGDLLEKKITLPLIKLLEDADEDNRAMVISSFESDVPDIEMVLKLMGKYKSIEQSKKIASSYAAKCTACLNNIPSNAVKSKLLDLVNFLVYRCY